MQSLRRFSLLGLMVWSAAHADAGKVSLSAGFFSIDATAEGQSSQISNPSAFHVAYLQPRWEQFELKIGYSLIMADFSGSDLGYGLDAGVNYFPFTSAADEKLETPHVAIKRTQLWRPLVGVAFNQRNFQSVRNSYAGFGFNAGVERYYDEKINLKAEMRYTSLGGSNESEATETMVLVGVVFKL